MYHQANEHPSTRLDRALFLFGGIVLLFAGCLSYFSSQTTVPKFCGHFGWQGPFQSYDLLVKCDSTFEWREYQDAGGPRPIVFGKWRTSGDTVLVSTEVQPKIIRVEETTDTSSKLTIVFSDFNGLDITDLLKETLTVRINGSEKIPEDIFSPFVIEPKIILEGMKNNQPIASIEFVFDRISIVYAPKRYHANCFRFTLSFARSDVNARRDTDFHDVHFFCNEPLLFHNDAFCFRGDFQPFHKPDSRNTAFDSTRVLPRVR